MSTFRLRLSQLVFLVFICAFVFTSCNSSKHIAGTYFQNKRNFSKSIRRPYKTKTHKKRKYSSIKCNNKKIIYVNQDIKRAINSEIIEHKTDFTLIILKEQNKFLQYEEMMYVPKIKSITPPEVVTYNQHKRIKKIQKVF
jgi:hypothetical protein